MNDKQFSLKVAQVVVQSGGTKVGHNHILMTILMSQEFGKAYNKYSGGYLNWIELLNKVASKIYIKNDLIDKEVDEIAIEARIAIKEYIDEESMVNGLELISMISKDRDSSINEFLLFEYGETLEPFVEWYREVGKNNEIEIKKSSVEKVAGSSRSVEEKSDNENLNKWCINLTSKTNKQNLSMVVGRDSEIERLESILLRRKKSNPIVVGDAGVGKSAMVEGLARKILDGKVSEELVDCKIYSLSYGTIMAGTRYRGDLEDRIQGIINELKEDKKNILFIDEIHLIMKGDMDIAEILKPELARGSIRCIGATTFSEWRQHFSKDAAMERRFRKIYIDEPSMDEMEDILIKSVHQIEKHYKISISKKIIKETIKLGEQYVSNQRFPDKAFDILDEVGVSLMMKKRKRASIADVRKAVRLISDKNVSNGFDKDTEYFGNLKKNLMESVVGQECVIDKVVDHMMVVESGLNKPKGPKGVYLFRGASGVGKTMLAKELAKQMEEKVIKLDMGEYSDSSSVSRLIGSPPGYVGHEEGGALIEKVMANPNSLILLDEIEKAHNSVLNSILGLLEDGVMTDGQGRECDFSQTTIIMSSNAGSGAEAKGRLGFGKDAGDRIEKEAKKTFTPEFYNRIDMILNFNKITSEGFKELIRKKISDINTKVNKKNISFFLSKETEDWLVEKCIKEKMGARGLMRVFDGDINIKLSRLMVEGKSGKFSAIVEKGKISILDD